VYLKIFPEISEKKPITVISLRPTLINGLGFLNPVAIQFNISWLELFSPTRINLSE